MKRRLLLLKLIIMSCFLFALSNYYMISLLPDHEYQWRMLILTLIGTLSYFMIRKIEFGNMYWLSIVPIFILGYLIVFYQMLFLDLIGYSVAKMYYKFVWADQSVMNQSVGVATLGLLAFYLGILSFKNTTVYNTNKFSTQSITILLILAYLFYILFFLTAGSYSSGVYASQDASGIAVYFYKVFEASLIASIILKLSYITSLKREKLSFINYLSSFGKPLLVLLGWHLVFSVYVGDRGPLITYSLLTFGLYFIRWKKLNIIYLIVGLLVMSTFMTIIGEVRSSGESSGSFSEKLEQATNVMNSSNEVSKKFDMHVPGSETVELALSVNTLNHVLYNVPEREDYRYGRFQLQYIFGIIPGLAGRMNVLLYGKDTKYYDSSNFITYLIQGDHRTYGNGTSVLADFYIDFGVLGVICGLFLFGMFIRKNESKLFYGYQYPTFLWIATLIFFSKALYINRSSIGQELAAIAMIFILIKMNSYFVRHLKKDYYPKIEKKK